MFGKGKQLIGLDIGTSAVKLVVLKEHLKGYSLQTLGYEPLPPEVIVDGAIMDSGIVIDAIQKIVKNNKIRNKNVALSVSGHSVIVKKITLPKMSQEELDESIHWEAEQYIPFDIDDVNIDFHILKDQDIGGNEMEVILVAVKKDKVNDYTNLVRQAGLNPVVVDVDGFAIGNQYKTNYEASSDQVVALIDIGAGVMNINIMQGKNHMLYRDISIGGNQFTDAIQKELNVSYQQAEAIKRGEDVEGISRDVANDVINSVAEDLCHEIQRSFDYFKATTSAASIDQVVLTGGCSKLMNSGLASFLGERLGVEVVIGDPLRGVTYNQKKFDPVLIEELGPVCAVALGLALRKDRPHDPEMILINMLPHERKKASVMTIELIAACALILVVLAGVGIWSHYLTTVVAENNTEIARKRQQLEDLRVIIEQVNQYERDIESLQNRINTINQLRDNQIGPVMMMEEINRRLPGDVWFSQIRTAGDLITIRGVGLTHSAIGDFMTSLETSPYFHSVSLKISRLITMHGREVYEFELDFRTQV